MTKQQNNVTEKNLGNRHYLCRDPYIRYMHSVLTECRISECFTRRYMNHIRPRINAYYFLRQYKPICVCNGNQGVL